MLKFLIVDDEETAIELIEYSVKLAYPYAKIAKANSNKDAFDLMDNFCPNLIITDINRPFSGGFEFLTKVRESIQYKHIPVMAISGSSQDPQNELLQYRHGFNAVLKKPFKNYELVEKINKILYVRTNPDSVYIHLGHETPEIDYKENVNINDKNEAARLAKDIIAMANYGGGKIVLGVKEKSPGIFEAKGLPENDLEKFEITKLNKSLRQFFDPHINICSRIVVDGGKCYIFIEVPKAGKNIILVKRQNENAGLYPGRIYCRNSSCESSEIQNYSELRRLLDAVKDEIYQDLLTTIKR